MDTLTGAPAPIAMPPSYTLPILIVGVVMLLVAGMYSYISFQQEATASLDTKVRLRINALVPNHFLYALTFLVGICALWLGDFAIKESQAVSVLEGHVAGIEQVTNLTGPDALLLVESAARGREAEVEVMVEQGSEIVPGHLKTTGDYVFLMVYNEDTGKYEAPPVARVV